ncbi:MAG: hypothetical protein OEW19_12315 [Acidobacteriota bacterium]|nr:hypothetical protein [Acidobacteriota bacterium]
MSSPTSTRWRPQPGHTALAIIAIVLLAVTGILSLVETGVFQPYFGGLPPLMVVAVVIVLGGVCLSWLMSRHGLRLGMVPSGTGNLRVPVAAATLMAIVVIAVDVAVGYPRDINVAPPASLVFYPLIACVAEIVFHVAPLTLLLLVLGPVFRRGVPRGSAAIVVCLAALPESVFQVRLGATGDGPSVLDMFTGVHLFVFGLVALSIFRRYDFASMLAFRLVYYLYWHVVWGYLRLSLRF